MKFAAGKYYVGDLCYVLSDRWDEFCSLTIANREVLSGGFVMKDGTRFWTHTTMYGDGSYHDGQGREYGVDAGLIGVVSMDQIDENPNCLDGGQVIEFKAPFEPYYKDGLFFIGNVVIDTSGNNDYDREYEDDEEFEDEQC